MKGLIEVAPKTWVNPDQIAWIEDTPYQAILHLSDGMAVNTGGKSVAEIGEMIKSLNYAIG